MVSKMSRHLRVLIVDDSTRARQSIRALIGTHPAVDAMAEATNGFEAVALAETWMPDVVLMDVRMAGIDGLEATRMIKARCQLVKIIILSMYGDYEAQALEAGADAFVSKGEPPTRLLQTLDTVIGA